MGGVRANNNIIEATWSRIKRNMNTVYMERGAVDDIIHYHVIHHNFIKPHFAHPKMRVERHGIRNEVNMTPVRAAGYPFWFANFEDLIRESMSYDKSFVFKLKDDMLARLTVGIHGNKTAGDLRQAGDPHGNDRQDRQDTPDRVRLQTGLQKMPVVQRHRIHPEHEGDPHAQPVRQGADPDV